MREPEKLYPLKIGLIGYNRQQTQHGMRVFAYENRDKVCYFTKNKIILEDETEIHAIYNMNDVRNKMFDQLILCDDERWNVLEERKAFIEDVLRYITSYSCVPYDFLVMKFEY